MGKKPAYLMSKRLFSLMTAILVASVAHAADCPSSSTLKKGFVLEKDGISSEVRRGDGPITNVLNIYSAYSKQTVFYFRGLIELFRTSETAQVANYPMADLTSIFSA
jgi:hypothetical protein